MVGIRKIWRE